MDFHKIFTEILLLGAALLIDKKRTDMTMLIGAFHGYAKAVYVLQSAKCTSIAETKRLLLYRKSPALANKFVRGQTSQQVESRNANNYFLRA
jgi:hypothetical protein